MDPRLAAWQSYYVIVGSAGAALIGIQFVVITLVGGLRTRPNADTLGAFSTPNVVHFTAAMLVSAIMSVPWPALQVPTVLLSAGGLAGVVYSFLVILRARRQKDYSPVWQDWLWYAIVPSLTYFVLAVASLSIRAEGTVAMGLVAATALGFLLIGIHNAWDSVVHIVVTQPRRDDDVDSSRQ